LNKIFLGLMISTLVGCTSGSGSPEGHVKATVKNVHPGVGIIYVLGDSLANGRQALDPDVTPAGCLEKYFDQDVRVLAQDGATSHEILNQVQEIKDEGAKLVFISSGGNDAIMDNYGHNYPTAQTLKEMNEIFDSLLSTGAFVAYLGLDPHVPGGERLPQISALAESKGVLVVDGMNGFWGNPEFMSPDKIHPNDHGYAVMCSRILGGIKGSYP
jgi:lysophospholipase L1-like esterase